MKTYIFSILVRGLLALSGFLVFLVSSKLFGADGRGIISYGTSVFASLGLIFSFNLGRTFLGKTVQNDKLKRSILFSFLVLNIGAVVLTAVLGFLYWLFSDSARGILEFNVLVPMMTTSLYYVWFINGNSFFASLQKTFQQDMVLLTTRFVLVGFLVIFTLADIHNLPLFVSLYAMILCSGVAVEILLLFKILDWPHEFPRYRDLKAILSDTIWPHIEFLSFNLYPAVLIVIAGGFLEKAEIGRVSFAIQIINLVFLLSTTAHLRVSAYVSSEGFRAKIAQLKKLFYWTLALSCLGSSVIYLGLHFLVRTPHLMSFDGVADLFAIATLSIPGYLIYQFFNPIWLELKKIRESAILNVTNFTLALVISPYVLKHYQETGGLILFSIFHLGLFAAQMILYWRVTRKNS